VKNCVVDCENCVKNGVTNFAVFLTCFACIGAAGNSAKFFTQFFTPTLWASSRRPFVRCTTCPAQLAAQQQSTAPQPTSPEQEQTTETHPASSAQLAAQQRSPATQPASQHVSQQHRNQAQQHSQPARQPAQLAAQQKRDSYATRQHTQERRATQPGSQQSSKYTPGKGTTIRYPTPITRLIAQLKHRHLTPKHQTHAGVEP
jgi:hypothetical protein